MNGSERRQILIRYLLDERREYGDVQIPRDGDGQRALIRGLMNVRAPAPISAELQELQDEYLREETARKGIVELSELTPVQPRTYLWRGDITRLACGAIVNAANSGMTGCYRPCHNCIDNCIHTYAGMQLRNYCSRLMAEQGHPEPTGSAKITPAFNLPCRYVIHTVGPIVEGRLTQRHRDELASCYRACLEKAEQSDVGSIAFCCISTGVFMFPNEAAAEIAVGTVRDYREKTNSGLEVIFNVFTERDERIYRGLLGEAAAR